MEARTVREEDHILCWQVREIHLGSFRHVQPRCTITIRSHGSSKVQHMKDAGALYVPQGYPHQITCALSALYCSSPSLTSSNFQFFRPLRKCPPPTPLKKIKRYNLWYDDKVKVSCAGKCKQPLFILRGTRRNAVSLGKMSQWIWWSCENEHLSYYSLFFQTW